MRRLPCIDKINALTGWEVNHSLDGPLSSGRGVHLTREPRLQGS